MTSTIDSGDLFVGIDLGGTLVRGGLVNHLGRLLDWQSMPIEANQGPQAGMERIHKLIDQLLSKTDRKFLRAVGIGSTGPLDRERGSIQNPYTLPGWEDVPVAGPLSQAYGLPVILENDADSAALGEYWQGAGRGVERLYMLTIGTGVGTSFIYHGAIYRGTQGAHPEGGHMVLDMHGPACYCGAHGCLESLVAGPAITRRARQLVAQHPNSQLQALAGGDPLRVDARLLMQAARAADAASQGLVRQIASEIALGLLNIGILYLPDVIALGGGVFENQDLFQPAIQAAFRSAIAVGPINQVKILPAQLGRRAGVYGAAYAAMQSLSQNPEL
jgi:glucokinase